MIAWCAIVLCVAAMAAFRAAAPERLARETGWSPADSRLPVEVWRPGCRVVGSLLLTAAFILSVHFAGAVEGLLLAAGAAMSASIVVTLAAPVARRLVWGAAALALAAAPPAVLLVLVYGGSHAAG